MPINRLLAVSATMLFAVGCTQNSHLMKILGNALPADASPTLTDSCTSFLGFGPAVGIFEVSPEAAREAAGFKGRFADTPSWSQHGSMVEFAEVRSREIAGINATLLDGKDCLREMTAGADEIMFGDTPGTYYSSPDQQVVIVLLSGDLGKGAIFIQSP